MEKSKRTGRNYKTGTERSVTVAFRASKIEKTMMQEALSLLNKKGEKAISYTDMFVMLASEKLQQLKQLQNS